jgi:hypothetical protein
VSISRPFIFKNQGHFTYIDEQCERSGEKPGDKPGDKPGAEKPGAKKTGDSLKNRGQFTYMGRKFCRELMGSYK